MSLRFSVLASGSGGNASLLQVNGFGLLLDAGLGPRQLAWRMKAIGASWRDVHAVLLTHTHSDHWHERTFAHLRRQRVPLVCHADHHSGLQEYSASFAALENAGLLRGYEPAVGLRLTKNLRCLPLPLRHDGGATFGFRFESAVGADEPRYALGYVADLGSWTPGLVQDLADVDLLALEFNHDVELEHASGRSSQLIARVLGDHGHLSNAQAAALLRAVLAASVPGRLQHVVQLHLSQDCNRPALAVAAAQAVLQVAAEEIQLHTACQHQSGPCISLGTASAAGPNNRPQPGAPHSRRKHTVPVSSQNWLPGFER